MFTLKLYRRVNHDTVITHIVPCHHVQTMTFEHADQRVDYPAHKGLELWAFNSAAPSDYETYLIGEPEHHAVVDQAGDVVGMSPKWYGWGLLENENGRTTEHFRPASYG